MSRARVASSLPLSPLPITFCSVFVPSEDLWCITFVNLTVLPLGVGADFEGFHPNSYLSFLVLCSSPISSTRYAAHRLLLDLPHAPCDVLLRCFSDQLAISFAPFVNWFRAYLASPPRRASFVPYRCWSLAFAQSATLLCRLSFQWYFLYTVFQLSFIYLFCFISCYCL